MTIKLENIGKRYRFEWIFKDVNYVFQAGKQYAILGPNGSGKSTLLQVLSGYLSPTKGKCSFSIGDKKLEIADVYQNISYAAPYVDIIEELTLLESIEFHQKFKPFLEGISSQDILNLLNFKRAKHKDIRFFSSGMKQRLKLVLALCSDTPVVLLDEPTTNLDSQGVEWYRDLIERYGKNRLLIIASNIEHDYDFCDETISIMDYKVG